MIKCSTLKTHGKYLAVYSNEKEKYILGFMSNKDAHCVKRMLPEEPKVYVKSGEPKDITHVVRTNMLESNMPIYNIADKVILDTKVEIVFPKMKFEDGIVGPFFDVHEVDYERFMSFPLYNNIGIIMPYELMYSNDDMFVYRANLMSKMLKDNAGNLNDVN